MPKSKLFLVVILICLVVGCKKHEVSSSAPPAQAGQPRHSVDVVKATAQEVTIHAGDEGDAVVQLNIEKGYHVNANPPTFPYLKATTLELPQTPEVTVSFIVYPNPLTKTFPFADKPLAVYEGVTDIKTKLKVAKTTKVGQRSLPAKLQVQACDDQVCYAPGTLDVSIPLIVK